MALKNSAHVCELKRRGVFVTGMLRFDPLHCPSGFGSRRQKRPQKTDAELTKALIGTWKLFPSLGLFARETFLQLDADGTSKAIGISTERHAPWRLEVQSRR